MLVFVISPTRDDLAEPAHDSAPVGPEGGDPRHASDADDLRCNYFAITRVHQFVCPIELVAPNPETELVVEAVRGKHVPVGIEFPWMGLTQKLQLMVEVRLLGLRSDDFQPGSLLPTSQSERAHPQAAAQYARYELR